MNSIRIKWGFAALAVITIFIFQNCNKSAFSPISSTDGDITDPVIANSAKCEYDGKQYLHSQKIITFKASSVAFDKQCEEQEHICNNGTWSGTIGFKNCGIDVARDCKIGDETISHGTTVERFLAATVPYNGNCQSEARRCWDGEINGSFAEKSCSKQEPPHALNTFVCKQREGQSNHKVLDLYQKWSDGSSRKVETCSNWHAARDNASWNCGYRMDGIIGAGAPTASQPSCCPEGYTVTNGNCHPIAQRGQACFGPIDCADGLSCETDYLSDSTPHDRTCQ